MNGFMQQYDSSNLDKVNRLFNQVENSTYSLPRENLDAMRSVPLKAGVNKGALTFTHKVISELGIARIVSSNAKDLPPVSRAVELKTVPIKIVGDSYSFTQEELDAWLFAGQGIDTSDADTARRKIDEAVDRIVMLGDKDNGIYGLLNNPNVTVATLGQNSSSETAWSKKTLAEITKDIQGLLDAIFDATKGANGGATVTPDTIKIPRDAFVHLTTHYKSDDSDRTLLDVLKASFAPQGLVNWESCNAGNGAGVARKDRLCVYARSEENLYAVVPELFRILPAQYEGLSVVYNCFARVGGTVFRRPTTAVYADGV